MQPSGTGTIEPPMAGDGRIRKSCSGVPRRITNVLHFPSLPSNSWEGSKRMGAGVGPLSGSVMFTIWYLGRSRCRSCIYKSKPGQVLESTDITAHAKPVSVFVFKTDLDMFNRIQSLH